MVCVKLYVHQMLCPIKSVKIVTTAASNVRNVKLRLQIAKYVNWDISSKEWMKLMHHACQNALQENILMDQMFAKHALINVFYVKQPLNVLSAEN